MDAIDRKILAVVQDDASLSVAEIGSRGLLEMRNSSQYVAARLGISRATLYNALGRARKLPARAKA